MVVKNGDESHGRIYKKNNQLNKTQVNYLEKKEIIPCILPWFFTIYG